MRIDRQMLLRNDRKCEAKLTLVRDGCENSDLTVAKARLQGHGDLKNKGRKEGAQPPSELVNSKGEPETEEPEYQREEEKEEATKLQDCRADGKLSSAQGGGARLRERDQNGGTKERR